ncbi:MAG: anhydro-N-acetylmuramic acid kinase [Gallionellaceae bacterium]|nr:anhydro-N-acetylmuramic acid kinase [Gallionellaceae bacterium]
MSNQALYVGLMSGTSLDGIDAVLVAFAPHPPHSIQCLASHYQPYRQSLKDSLLALHHPAHDELHQAQLISNALAQEYASATVALLQTAHCASSQVRAIGCHGQTIRHRPELGYTVQLGNAALLAELSGISVVSDFRSRDLAAGGQGAPLVPVFHDRVMRHPTIHRVIVNIGGISNLTNLPPGQPTTGFDCGPGNLLMDAWIARHHGKSYDQDGAWATTGHVIPALLRALLQEPFLHTAPPKSSGRDLFNLAWLHSKLHGGESPADVQASLLAYTSRTISDAIQHYCEGVQEIYLCGGGSHNLALVQSLQASLGQCSIQSTDVLGMNADYVEAIAFAWLAQQTMGGHSANLPAATGARHPCILGAIYQA